MKKIIAYMLLTLLIVNPTFATFNVVASGDPILAAKAMQNWRHLNYGSTLLPVTIGGAGVDSTIDLGSDTYRFKDLWTDNIAGGIVFNEAGSDVDFRVEGVGAANALFVQGSNGNVGIGTSAPNLPLDVQANSGGSAVSLRGRDNAGIDDNFLKFYKYDGTTLQGAIYALSNEMRFRDATNTDVMTIKAGNIGIGETAPSAKLEVLSTTTQALLSYSNGVDTSFAVDSGGDLKIDTSGGDVTVSDNVIVDGYTALGADNTAIKIAIVTIGDWNMWVTTGGGSATLSVAHGLTLSKIIGCEIIIRSDTFNKYWLDHKDGSFNVDGTLSSIDSTNVNMTIRTGGLFDSSSFNETTFNRGWVKLTYIE